MSQDRAALPENSRIDCYRLLKVIGKGGFSLIYLAVDDETGDEVVIKEFMPKRIGLRDGARLVPAEPRYREALLRSKRLFFQEVKAMAKLRHEHIVGVRGFYLANDTAYLVMQHERGRNLGQFIHARNGGLSSTLMMRIFLPVLDALALIHSRSMLHLDVKPGNIHLRNGHDPLLLDLGAVHLMSLGRAGGSQVITAGYSPPEQYTRDGDVGPWTDVYAVGATLRCCIEGVAPQAAPERMLEDKVVPALQQFRDRYPDFLLTAIDAAMELRPERRPRDAGAMLRLLMAHPDALPQSALRDLPALSVPVDATSQLGSVPGEFSPSSG